VSRHSAPPTIDEDLRVVLRRHVSHEAERPHRAGLDALCADDRQRDVERTDKTRYAPSFVAHLIVSKCADSIPQYRIEKAYRRLGIPISRSTMCDLLHRGARELQPLYAAALALVPLAQDVHADETSIRQLGINRRAFI
jgi:hypothetical protein